MIRGVSKELDKRTACPKNFFVFLVRQTQNVTQNPAYCSELSCHWHTSVPATLATIVKTSDWQTRCCLHNLRGARGVIIRVTGDFFSEPSCQEMHEYVESELVAGF